MQENNLPIEQLKTYGIMNEDNSFSKKLSSNDIKRFLEGAIIIADNNKDRVIFQLIENNSRLMVKQFHRDKAIKNLLEDSRNEIQYIKEYPILSPEDIDNGNKFKLKSLGKDEDLLITSIRRDENGVPTKIYFTDINGEEFNISFEEFKKNGYDLDSSSKMDAVKVFIYDEKEENVREYDLLKNITEITKIVAETKKENEVNKYKVELQKLMSFIQDKIDKFPELGKQLTENINIVNNELQSVNSISTELNKKSDKTKIEYDVNDPDLYQDANRKREEEQEIEIEKKRGRTR